jgi:hypothetical protein
MHPRLGASNLAVRLDEKGRIDMSAEGNIDMSAEENRAVFLQFFEDVWGGRFPEDDEWLGEIRAVFPDFKVTPDKVLAAEGGHVVIMFTGTATHQGGYRDILPPANPSASGQRRLRVWRTGRSSTSSLPQRRWVR